jgi:hypothetical protein
MELGMVPACQRPVSLEHPGRSFAPGHSRTARPAKASGWCRRLATLAAGLFALAWAGCGSPGGASTDTVNSASLSPAVATAAETSEPAASIAASALAATPTPSATKAPETPADPGKPYVPAESVDTEIRRLTVNFENKRVNIKNGGKVMLGDGLAAEIFADPYPPTTLTVWVDLYLTHDGEPLADEGMGIDYDMLAMVHGPFWGEAENLGGGHYLFKLDYIMFGPWEQTVTIRIGLQRIRIPLIISAHP